MRNFENLKESDLLTIQVLAYGFLAATPLVLVSIYKRCIMSTSCEASKLNASLICQLVGKRHYCQYVFLPVLTDIKSGVG